MAVFGSLGTPNRVFSPQMSTSGHLYAPRGTRRQLGDTPASFAVRITLLSMQNRVFAPRKLGTVKTTICMVMTLGMPVSMAECHWATPRGIREAWETSTGISSVALQNWRSAGSNPSKKIPSLVAPPIPSGYPKARLRRGKDGKWTTRSDVS